MSEACCQKCKNQPVYSTIKRNTAWNDPEINSVHLRGSRLKLNMQTKIFAIPATKENPVEQKLCLYDMHNHIGSEIIRSRLDSGCIKFTKKSVFSGGDFYRYVFPCLPSRFEQQGRPASREASQRQRELELRWWRLGGNQHLHREEEGLRDAIAALQALAVGPLAEAAAAGETIAELNLWNVTQLQTRRHPSRSDELSAHEELGFDHMDL